MAVYNGTGGPDTYLGTIEDDSISGNGGDDHLEGSTGSDFVDGGSGDDQLFSYDQAAAFTFFDGDGSFDSLYGGSGDDSLYGDADTDSLDGGTGNDFMDGLAGDDFYYVDSMSDTVFESRGAFGGYDWTYSSVSRSLDANLEGLVLLGNQSINGTGNGLANAIDGNSGANSISGGGGADVLNGFDGNDTMTGGSGDDTINGGRHNDTVRGQGGADILLGGFDADIVIGGAGNDTYRYTVLSTSVPGARDQIRAGDGGPAFANAGNGVGDLIDVSGIDADTTVNGNQTFQFGGVTQMGRGFLWVANSGTDTIVRGNVNNNNTVEFEIEIEDGANVVASDYRVTDFIL